jgi:hypothetical protein
MSITGPRNNGYLDLSSLFSEDGDGYRETELKSDGRGNLFSMSYSDSGALSDTRLIEAYCYENEEL